jgi:hypothetical protein
MRSARILFLGVVFALVADRSALACSCSGFSTFEQTIREAPLVVVGRVASIGTLRSAVRGGTDPRVIALDVVWTAKGSVQAKRVDVWNEAVGSTCDGSLWRVGVVGSHAVLALTPVRAAQVGPEWAWKRTGVLSPRDIVLALAVTACGESFLPLKGERDLARWVGKTIK